MNHFKRIDIFLDNWLMFDVLGSIFFGFCYYLKKSNLIINFNKDALDDDSIKVKTPILSCNKLRE